MASSQAFRPCTASNVSLGKAKGRKGGGGGGGGGTYPQLTASTIAMQKASVSEVFKNISPWTNTCTSGTEVV